MGFREQAHTSNIARPHYNIRTMIRLLALAVLILLSLAGAAGANAPEAFFQHPALSADGRTVWFSAHGDIWAAARDGSAPARRLTDNVAHEDMPIPSPDSSLLAFQSNRFGSTDVFVMPVDGGAAMRLSWDSNRDSLLGWKADGSGLLVSTRRQDWLAACLYFLPLDGGQPQRITGPDHDDHEFADYIGSTDSIVYTRGPGYTQRKRHHGQDSYNLWRYDAETKQHSPLVTQHGKDAWPQLSRDGNTLYFVSDRDGTDNIYSMPTAGGHPARLTDFKDEGPQYLRLSSDGDELTFIVFGTIWTMQLDGSGPLQLRVTLHHEDKHESSYALTVQGDATEMALSPNGNYFALVVEGDIHLLKNPESYPEDAQPDQDLSLTRPLVTSPGRDWQVSWHHEDRKICYISDRTGEYDIYMFDLATGEETQLTKTPYDEALPRWSPVDNRIAYYYGNHELHVLDVGEPGDLLISRAEHRIGPFGGDVRWSPDGQWLAYSYAPVAWSSDVFITPSSGGKEINVTMTPDSESDPVWSADGRWLGYSFSSSDDYSNEYGRRARLLELDWEPQLYDAELLFPEDMPGLDETAADDSAADDGSMEDGEDGDAAADELAGDELAGDEDEILETLINFDEIENRATTLPPWGGDAQFRLFSPDGGVAVISLADGEGSSLAALDTETGELEVLSDDWLDNLQFNADGTRLYGLGDGMIQYIDLDWTSRVEEGSIASSSRLQHDEAELRHQSFLEMWRTLRDNFYDKDMHGTDWQAVRKKYEPLLQVISTPEEYNELMEHFVGELAASHSWFFMPESSAEVPRQISGALGVILREDYSGPGWLVSRVIRGTPAWRSGSELYPGDVILAVNGAAVDMRSQRDRIMLGEAGELVRLEVQNGPAALEALAAAAAKGEGDAADDEAETDSDQEIEDVREVLIIPDSARGMYGPFYEQWVRDNRAVVDELGAGKIAYQHIEGMDFRSLARFRRELYSMNREKDALIIDVRFNGGGDIYAQLYDILTSHELFRSKTRFEQLRATPEWHWHGPIVVLINAYSYSDAEDFAHMMQEQQLATIVGEDTGGNVIAVSGVGLLDGSFFGLPLEGWYRMDGRNMEGFGCPADIVVEIDPNALAAGHDNQLEAAIAELQRQLGDT